MLQTEEVVRQLVASGDWGETDARISARANFRCEYCDLDILDSVRAYKEWNKDHIVPKYAGGSDSLENLALACRTCNFSLKNRWNPQTECEPDAGRDQLVAAVRDYVSEKSTRIQTQLQEFRKIAFGEAEDS